MAERDAGQELRSADIQRLLALLPHRAPMLMIDRVVDMVLGQSARGLKAISFNEPVFTGHFPGHPIFPGVLIVEAMAQTAGALVVETLGGAGSDKLVYFMTIDKARFRAPVGPGDLLELPVKLARHRGPVWRFTGEALVQGRLCAEAEFSAMIMDRNGKPSSLDA